MAKLVNLKSARKARARAAKAATGAERAAAFGRSKAQKEAEAKLAVRLRQDLDGHRRDRPEDR